MLNKGKTKIVGGVTYTMMVSDEGALQIVCDRCLLPKKVKRFYAYESNGHEYKICNACFSDVCQAANKK